MSNKEYDQEFVLTNQLQWSYFSSRDGEDQKHLDNWDKRRDDLKATIEKIKKEN